MKDFNELIANTTSEWTTINGVNGYILKSKQNENCIFFPAAGWRVGVLLHDEGKTGCYWCSTLNEDNIFSTY